MYRNYFVVPMHTGPVGSFIKCGYNCTIASTPVANGPAMAEEKKGPKRKKHRNSKLGCATCKRRRVKCLEDLPACNNCIKHRVQCEYLDYTEAQLEEFRKAKRAQQMEQDLPVDSNDQLPPLGATENPSALLETLTIGEAASGRHRDLTTNANLEVRGHHILDHFHEDIAEPLADVELPDNFMADLLLTPPSVLPGADSIYEQDLSQTGGEVNMAPATGQSSGQLNGQLRGGLPEVFEFQSGAITQDFENLLPEQKGKIIYPVYRNNNTDSESRASSVPSSAGPYMTTPTGPFGAVRDVFLNPLNSAPQSSLSKRALANAIILDRKFQVPQKQVVNYVALLFQVVSELSPLISQGRAILDDIRRLYHIWLCYFIFKGFSLSVMFLCLTNLTTNYLITNVFQIRDSAKFDVLVSSKRLRNILVVRLIQHYAHVIKQLLTLLNKNGDPEMAASISYILSLMAIYDPEATADSTKCFRDGMFSVLSYTLHLAQKNNVAPPRLIPIHLHLMTNVARTVYLPAYNSSFLLEYEKMLARFGAILQEVSRGHVSNPKTLAFVHQEYAKLWQFCQKTLNSYTPEVNKNLDNIKYQEELFFQMFHEWASLQPSRLLMVRKSTDPLEKVLNLFCRLFRKAVFAVMPQVRFFYLRDFDSPLMLDVFVANKDPDVFGELDYPEQLCISPALYSKFKDEIKVLAAYSIRLITFLSFRLSILYRNLVYNDRVRTLYPITNIVEWRNSITDIKRLRDEFHERIGLLEYPILSFNNTYIAALHYPQIIDPLEPGSRLETPHPPEVDQTVGEVELLSMQPLGLLAMDALPAA